MELIQNCFKSAFNIVNFKSNTSNRTNAMESIPSNWEKASFWMRLPKPLQAHDVIRIKGLIKGEVKGHFSINFCFAPNRKTVAHQLQIHVYEQAGIKKLEKMIHKWSHGSKWQPGVEGRYLEIINDDHFSLAFEFLYDKIRVYSEGGNVIHEHLLPGPPLKDIKSVQIWNNGNLIEVKEFEFKFQSYL